VNVLKRSRSNTNNKVLVANPYSKKSNFELAVESGYIAHIGNHEPYLKHPRVGEPHKVFILDEDDTSIETVIPRVMRTQRVLNKAQINDPDYDHYIAHICWKVKEDSSCKTVIGIPGYSKFLVDPEYYIVKRHGVLNGKIDEWRKASIDLLNKTEEDEILGHTYSPSCYLNQQTWIETKIPIIMKGIQKFLHFAVDTMHERALMQHVEGVNIEEEANFVFNMCTSNNFYVVIKPLRKEKTNTVVTVFDESSNEQAYEVNVHCNRKH
jgi:hypothetical protein